MRFLIDENLPVSLVSWLRSEGHLADHVLDLSLGATDDRQIAARARSLEAVIVTKDRDYVAIAKSGTRPGIVWLRLGNMNSAAVVATCSRAWPGVVQALNEGEVIVEVRQDISGS